MSARDVSFIEKRDEQLFIDEPAVENMNKNIQYSTTSHPTSSTFATNGRPRKSEQMKSKPKELKQDHTSCIPHSDGEFINDRAFHDLNHEFNNNGNDKTSNQI